MHKSSSRLNGTILPNPINITHWIRSIEFTNIPKVKSIYLFIYLLVSFNRLIDFMFINSRSKLTI